MIKTKYVVGDVVFINEKAVVVVGVYANKHSLYENSDVLYRLSNGTYLKEEEFAAKMQ